MRNWKVLEYGHVELGRSSKVEFTCQNCHVDSYLPVMGTAIAQTLTGLVFDIGAHAAVPTQIRCPWCRKTLILDEVQCVR